MGTNGKELQKVEGLGPRREEVSSHMHSESWIINGSEVKSRGQKAKEQRKGAASFRH